MKIEVQSNTKPGPVIGVAVPTGGDADSSGSSAAESQTTFTAAEVAAIVGRERRQLEERLSKSHAETTAKIQGELEELQSHLAAKSGAGAHAVETSTLERKLAATTKTLAERDADAARLEGELRGLRVDSALEVRVAAHGLTPEAKRFVLLGFRQDAKIEYNRDGSVAYVELGGRTFSDVAHAFDSWMSTNANVFVQDKRAAAAIASGATSGTPFYKRSTEDNIVAANALRGRH